MWSKCACVSTTASMSPAERPSSASADCSESQDRGRPVSTTVGPPPAPSSTRYQFVCASSIRWMRSAAFRSSTAAAPARSRSGRVGELTARQLLRGLLDLLKRVLLLLEVLLQEPHDVLLAHSVGLDNQTLVDRDLVVLGLRRAGQDHGIDHAVVGLLDVRLALLVDPLDG